MGKSADAFRTISEVAEWLDTPAHVLRFWESKFTQVKPVKRAGGRRYYRPADMRLLGGIKKLLHEDGMTIKGAQKILREQGIKHVASLCTLSVGEEDDIEHIEDVVIEEVPSAEPVDTVVPFSKPSEPAAQIATEVAEEPVVEVPAAEPEPEPEVAASQSESVADLAPEPVVAEAPAEEVAETIADATPVEDEQPAVVEDVIEEQVPETASLPGFLQKSMDDRIEEAASDEPESEVPAPEPTPAAAPAEPRPGALTYLSKINRLSPESAQQIVPLVERLRALAS